MFGFVTANWEELTEQEKNRYTALYCGICRKIRDSFSQTARMGLSYDMAFLALLEMSLYEPEETAEAFRCMAHPLKKREWVDNEYIGYAADMNVALAYYKALDDWQDDGKRHAKLFSDSLRSFYPEIKSRWPRQCQAIEDCIDTLGRMEKQGEENPDLPAGVFGTLMAELMVCREDLWADSLRQLGFQLGRFIYLADAMLDYDRDMKKGSYNPFAGSGKSTKQWEQYLLLAMSRCTAAYEKLPLVQDKSLLDNILYSGVWVQYRREMREEKHDSGSL